MKTSLMGNQRRGLTLLEVFIIIAAITVLCIVLLPFFFQKRNYHPRSCLNHLKRFTAALSQYKADANNRYPTRYIGNSPEAANPLLNPSRPGWIINPLKRYIKNVDVVECPLDAPKSGHFNNLFPPEWNLDEKGAPESPKGSYRATYAYNYAMFTDLKDADLDEPASTVLMWDSANNYFDEISNLGWSKSTITSSSYVTVHRASVIRSALSPNGDLYNYCGKEGIRCVFEAASSPDAEAGKRVMWHFDKGNIAWVDGHVSIGSFQQLKWNQLLKFTKAEPCYDQPMTACNPFAK